MRRACALVALLLLATAPAQARRLSLPDGSPTAQCLAAAQAAGVLSGIPDGLMARLAVVESGRLSPGDTAYRPWPWTIDADGEDLAFDTAREAVGWAAGSPRRGVRFIDVGCLQVNLQYHPHAFATMNEAFDPWANARYAARYLRTLYDEESGHDWSVAVGLYHSHTPELAAEYRTRVASLGEGIIAGLPPGPIAARLAALGTMRLQLAGGGVLRIQLNRQPVLPGHQRASPCAVAAAVGPMLAKPPRIAGCLRR